MPFSTVTPPTLVIPASPTKQRRKFMIPRKAPLRDTSSTATLKPNVPSTPPDSAPPPKTLRRTGRLQKLKLDLTGAEKRSSTPPQTSSPPSSSVTFMTQVISAPTPTENIPSSAVSVHSADVTLNLHNLSLAHLPFPPHSNPSDNGPKNPRETSEGNDAGKGPLLQFKPRGRVTTPRKLVPSTLNERSPFSPNIGFLLSTVEAPQSDPARPLHPTVVGLALEKDPADHASSSSDTTEERAHARSEWLRSLRNKTMSRLKSVNGLKELNELKKNVEICERRSSERPEGAVRVRVRANNMVLTPPSRTGTPLGSDATIGRSHPRLGSASSGSGLGMADPRTTPMSTPSSSLHSFRAHSRTSIAFADLPQPEHHPQLPEAKRTLGSWSRRSSGPGNTSRPTSPRRKSSLIGSMFSRPGSMSTHEEEQDHGTEELETMARKTEEMMRAAVWGKSVTDRRWSGASAARSHQYHGQRGSRSSVNIDIGASASTSRSSVDVRSSRSTSPLPSIVGQMQSVAPTTPTLQHRRRPSRLHKKSIDWPAAGQTHAPSAFQEPVSPRTPVARPRSPSHDEAARRSVGEFSEYVRTLPRSFATSYVAQLLEQEDKASPSTSAAPQRDKERRGSKAIAQEVSKKISAVFVGKR